MGLKILLIVFLFLQLPDFCLAQPSIKIIQKPILFDRQREQLTLQYLEDRYGMKQATPVIKPTMIVLHKTEIPTMQKTFDAFNQSTLPAARSGLQKAGALNVSSQFLVDRDGTIYQLMPENWMARHVIGLNYCAIGVENVGAGPDTLTAAQVAANVALIRYLKSKYPIQYMIGHSEYTAFRNTKLWKDKDPDYITSKTDPGKGFMQAVRGQITDLKLKGPATTP